MAAAVVPAAAMAAAVVPVVAMAAAAAVALVAAVVGIAAAPAVKAARNSSLEQSQRGGDTRPRWPRAQAASVIRFTSSVTILNCTSLVWPNVVVIAQSAASRPRAIKTRPMRGVLWRASKVNQRPPR
jgi:hypothetical protein